MDDFKIAGIFPVPIYFAKYDSNPEEEKEIKNIIEEGMISNSGNETSINNYIFNTKLKKLKEFCEHHLKQYVETVIAPKEELDFYITQSWLNVTKPGGFHHEHSHGNSIVSGVFYISTEEDDQIMFTDPKFKIREIIKLEHTEYNIFNSLIWNFPSVINELLLFPSWLNHMVKSNEKATTDRISLSFNTFIRGTLGEQDELTELILK